MDAERRYCGLRRLRRPSPSEPHALLDGAGWPTMHRVTQPFGAAAVTCRMCHPAACDGLPHTSVSFPRGALTPALPCLPMKAAGADTRVKAELRNPLDGTRLDTAGTDRGPRYIEGGDGRRWLGPAW